ncbi:MAG: 50S ribosomal protein L28 [Rhodospirillales bacterium]|nr:50S ribosomal protein L28 [Rhodospirillales bacterium]
MTRRCTVTGKGVLSGHHVSHANNKTKRKFRPNLQVASLFSDTLGATIRLRVSTHGLRTIEHNGGIDAYLLDTRDAVLTPETKVLKRRIEKARARKEAKAA